VFNGLELAESDKLEKWKLCPVYTSDKDSLISHRSAILDFDFGRDPHKEIV
jgi:hypothetical protein